VQWARLASTRKLNVTHFTGPPTSSAQKLLGVGWARGGSHADNACVSECSHKARFRETSIPARRLHAVCRERRCAQVCCGPRWCWLVSILTLTRGELAERSIVSMRRRPGSRASQSRFGMRLEACHYHINMETCQGRHCGLRTEGTWRLRVACPCSALSVRCVAMCVLAGKSTVHQMQTTCGSMKGGSNLSGVGGGGQCKPSPCRCRCCFQRQISSCSPPTTHQKGHQRNDVHSGFV
jgi:hypothetical protein